ncbi:MAG: antirestriction protein ArdA [Gammaproteobacteria bacterium]|nr:antirestriction protein ArdA [Gammaproteobacteria bacterium]
MSSEIRIYVADLAAYNAGKLHGVWIDASSDLETLQEQVSVMLASSPEPDAEEYAIHDYEGFADYSLSKYEGLQSVHEIACFIEEYPDFSGALLNHFSDMEEARRSPLANVYPRSLSAC